MRFRAAGPADAAAIADLLTASWQEAYAALLPASLLRDRLPGLHAATWRAHFAAPRDGIVLLAEGTEGLRGFCAAWLDGEEAYVDNLHLRPGLRGGGIGPMLLGRAVAALGARGARRAALTVIEGNDGALRFYRRLGGIAGKPYRAGLHGEVVRFRDITWPDAAALVRACGGLPA